MKIVSGQNNTQNLVTKRIVRTDPDRRTRNNIHKSNYGSEGWGFESLRTRHKHAGQVGFSFRQP